MASDLDPCVFPGLIEHFPDHQVLYCHSCQSTCFLSQLDRHLAAVHRIDAKRRRPVVQHCQDLAVAVAVDELPLGRDGSPPVPFLPILDGFACELCPFYSISRAMIRGHLNQVHQLQRNYCTIQYSPAKLQSWSYQRRAKYWRVLVAGATATATVHTPPGRPTVTDAVADTLEQLEEQECCRLEQLA